MLTESEKKDAVIKILTAWCFAGMVFLEKYGWDSGFNFAGKGPNECMDMIVAKAEKTAEEYEEDAD